MSRTLLIAVLPLLASWAGCLGPAPAPEPEPEPTKPYDPSQSFVVPYNATECQEGFTIRLITFEQAAKSLPPGYRALDAENLLGLPIARGKAAAYLTGVKCTRSEFAIGGMDEGTYGIAIQPPNVPGDRPPVADNFYEVGRFTSRENALILFQAIGWNVFEGAIQVVVSQSTGNLLTTGYAEIRNDEGLVQYDFRYQATQDDRLTGKARFWHQTTTNGTAYIEYTLDTPVRQGTSTCNLKPESEAYKVVGASNCPTGEGFAVVLPAYDFRATIHYLANVTAKP